jgi:hypothetical protein
MIEARALPYGSHLRSDDGALCGLIRPPQFVILGCVGAGRGAATARGSWLCGHKTILRRLRATA